MYFLPFFFPRSVLLRPSSSQSSKGSADWPDLWHPLYVCHGERRRPLCHTERGSGGQLQQGHRESGVPHLHQSYQLPQAAEHHRRLQIHQKYVSKIQINSFAQLLIQRCDTLFIKAWTLTILIYFFNKGPTSTISSRSSRMSEDSTLHRGDLEVWKHKSDLLSLNACNLIHWLSSCLSLRLVQGSVGGPEPGPNSCCWGACLLHGESHQQAECCQDDEDSSQRPGQRIQQQPLRHLLGKSWCCKTGTNGR